jgi:hypothetical protein
LQKHGKCHFLLRLTEKRRKEKKTN